MVTEREKREETEREREFLANGSLTKWQQLGLELASARK